MAASPQYIAALSGITLNNIAAVLVTLQEPQKALAVCQQSIEHHQKVFAAAPQLTNARKGLGISYSNLSQIYRALDRPAEAVEASLERYKLWPDNPGELSAVVVDLLYCLAAVGKGKTELTAAEQADRQRIADLTMKVLQ